MDLLHVEMNFYADEKQIKIHSQFTYSQHCIVLIRDGHTDIFSDTHRCVCQIYPTYVRYSVILSDNAEVDADIRIRMAIPSLYILDIPQPMGLVLQRLGLHRGMFPPKEPNCSKYKVDIFDMAFHLQKFTQIMATVAGQSSIFQPYLRLRLKLWRL